MAVGNYVRIFKDARDIETSEEYEKIVFSPKVAEVTSSGFITTGHANPIEEGELEKRFPKMWARAKLAQRYTVSL